MQGRDRLLVIPMDNRYNKPTGWRGEAHRHYLAAKYGSAPGTRKKYMAPMNMPLSGGYSDFSPTVSPNYKLKQGNTVDGARLNRLRAIVNPSTGRGWTDAQILANQESLKTATDKKGVPLLTDYDVDYIKAKFSGKQPLAAQFAPPAESVAPAGFNLGSSFNSDSGFGAPITRGVTNPLLAEPAVAAPQTKLIEPLNFGPSKDLPSNLSDSSEMLSIEADVDASQRRYDAELQRQNAIISNPAPSEPIPLTLEKYKQGIATPAVGLPENILI